MLYTDYIKRRIDLKENKVPWFFGHKYDTHEFCVRNGIPVPHLLKKFSKPEEIQLDGLPERFVLKPAYSSTSRGVLVLERVADDVFLDHMSGKPLSLANIIEIQQTVFSAHSRAKRKYTLVEEYVEDANTQGIPEDYKFLAFQGKIGIIIKINRNNDKLVMSYFDSQFRPIYDDRVAFKSELADLEISTIPRNWRRLLDVARRASVVVPTPFARIDLFDTTRGPVLGEVTLTPGSFYYPNGHVLSKEENARLGSLWREAEMKLWGSTST